MHALPAGADPVLRDKWERLLDELTAHEKLAVAFSGGVDSALLLRASQLALGDRVVALTALTETVAQDDARAAREVAASLGVLHREVAVTVMGVPDVSGNTPERCYACKREILRALHSAAAEEGFSAMVEGSTADDDDGDRPGHRALREFDVGSPLRAAGLIKEEVRQLSQRLGLAVWDKPSSACLATRIPTCTPLDASLLQRIDAAERSIRALGFRQLRVRCHGGIARLELPAEDFSRLVEPETRAAVLTILGEAGFRFGCLDLAGFWSGSMNRSQGSGTPAPSGGTS
jgi:uncharacterized protein